MAKLKTKKYPKKPKASASNAVKENYLARCKEVDDYNRHVHSENKKSKELDKKISGIGSARLRLTISVPKKRRKKATTKKRKTTKRRR